MSETAGVAAAKWKRTDRKGKVLERLNVEIYPEEVPDIRLAKSIAAAGGQTFRAYVVQAIQDRNAARA